MQTFSKSLLAIIIAFVSFLITMLSFEIVYRYQILDTYSSELKRYNSPDNLEIYSEKETILIMGDSFTAGISSYPEILANQFKEKRIINSGISGTGIIQANYIAPRRFRNFKPSVFIYQVYVGNDLFDIRYPINWRRISWARNFYWAISEHLRGLAFLNYKLGQANFFLKNKRRSGGGWEDPGDVHEGENFSAEKYNQREKIYISAEPKFLENQILVQKSRKKDYEVFLNYLETLLSFCDFQKCKAHVLIIPHACQITQNYLSNIKKIGAEFSYPDQVFSEEYPFIKGIRTFLLRRNFKNVQVLNPVSLFRENEKKGTSVYFNNDLHLNPKGQEILGKFVAENLGL